MFNFFNKNTNNKLTDLSTDYKKQLLSLYGNCVVQIRFGDVIFNGKLNKILEIKHSTILELIESFKVDKIKLSFFYFKKDILIDKEINKLELKYQTINYILFLMIKTNNELNDK